MQKGKIVRNVFRSFSRSPDKLTKSFSWLLVGVVALLFCGAPSSASFTDKTNDLTGGALVGFTIAWGDYDADGYVDFLNGNNVYHNEGPDATGDYSFTSVFGRNTGGGMDGIWGDYDNDGDLDIYSWSDQKMMRYDGGSSFTELGMPAVASTRYAATFADYDGNGYIDLFVAGGGASNQVNGMLLNTDGTAANFTKEWETGSVNTRGVNSVDVDFDGDMDIYVSNYWTSNNFYRNEAQTEFTTPFPDVGFRLDETPAGYTGGSAFGDMDGDGDFDAVTGNLDHGPQHSASVYENLDTADSYHFTEKFAFTGADYQEGYSMPALADYDNDGDVDILMCVWSGYGNANRLYRNDGNWTFTDVTAAQGLSDLTSGKGAAWADFDNDGDVDLITDNKIFVNGGNSNNWIKVKLNGDGTLLNKAAIGAEVRITVDHDNDTGTADITLTRQVEAGTGFGNQNDMTLHFGLGAWSGTVDLEIRVPGVGTWTKTGLQANHTITYEEVPEPATLLVLAMGAIGLMARRRR